MQKRISTLTLATAGMLTALVTLTTMLFTLPVPATGGYVHLGDSLILFSAMLAGRLAIPIGGIGSGLADLLGGYTVYVLPTMVIKGLVGFLASRGLRLDGEHALLRCALTFGVAELVMVAGYAIFESFAYGFSAAIAAAPMNLLQGAFSVALGAALLPVARRIAPMLNGGGKS